MKQLILVFIGGGLGSSLRYLISKFLNSSETGIPYDTFAANIIGSLFIGVILGFAVKYESLNNNQLLFITTGFCGGLTTFSTFAYENHVFLKSGDFLNFLLYTTITFVTGIIAVFIGIFLVKFI
ncbi:fluoride efflux transporter CrcB [Galbibacter orientalis]|uniref:fluoride efflux transporter CrcB n=1 Tax=Galbibacter orientalis TaxID=453852 RepID=UPI00308014FA